MPDKRYTPSPAVMNTKAGLALASMASGPFSFIPGTASTVYDLGTSARYAMDGQWDNAKEDLISAGLNAIPTAGVYGALTAMGKLQKAARARAAIRTAKSAMNLKDIAGSSTIRNNVTGLVQEFDKAGKELSSMRPRSAAEVKSYNQNIQNQYRTGATPEGPKELMPFKSPDFAGGGMILDPMGQWAHPGKNTRIPGSDITMQGVPYPVLGIASNGKKQMMYPGQDYNFGGAKHVDEYPMMQNGGGLLSRTVTCSNCGWSWKAVDGGIDPMTCHKCGGMIKMQRGGIIPIAQDGRTIRAANGEFSCAANPRSDLRASAASVSGGSSDPLRDSKNDYWGRIKEDWQAQGVNKESFNNMYEDSLRAGPAFENPLSAQYFDPSTGKARPGTPGRLRYYNEAGFPLGNRLTLEQIKNTALQQPKGIKGYNKLVKEDYPWGSSPFIPTKKNGGYVVTRSHDRKGKTHKVTGPDGTVKYFGDSKLGQHPNDPERKKAFYARHKKNLDNNPYFRAFARKTWEDGGETDDDKINDDKEMLSGVADILRRINDTRNRKEVANHMMENFRDEDVSFEPNAFLKSANVFGKGGEMIRRADGSYSRRGLWDNIRANKGSGKKPTKQMLEQERKIK